VDERGVLLAPGELRERLRASVGGIDADRIVCYCGSGITACHVLLALEHAGLHGAGLYPGSWSEWSSDPDRPQEKGPARKAGPEGAA
jgi:thiosulfate/3-mercaptopyruvate sulfurtransferase